jgi:hypothetical protein
MVIRVLVLITALSLIQLTPAQAQEKFGDKRIYHVLKAEPYKIHDSEGHVLVVSETHGYDTQRGSTAINRFVSDLVKGNGRTFGYGAVTEPDGDVLYYSFDGKVTTSPGATGKPVTSVQGTWTGTGGTGKWAQRDAHGVYKNTVINPTTSVAEWEGTWEPKR